MADAAGSLRAVWLLHWRDPFRDARTPMPHPRRERAKEQH
jgi:hypothetical protein